MLFFKLLTDISILSLSFIVLKRLSEVGYKALLDVNDHVWLYNLNKIHISRHDIMFNYLSKFLHLSSNILPGNHFLQSKWISLNEKPIIYNIKYIKNYHKISTNVGYIWIKVCLLSEKENLMDVSGFEMLWEKDNSKITLNNIDNCLKNIVISKN